MAAKLLRTPEKYSILAESDEKKSESKSPGKFLSPERLLSPLKRFDIKNKYPKSKKMYAKLDPCQLDPGQLDPGQLDPGQLDPGQLDPGQLDPIDCDPGEKEFEENNCGARSNIFPPRENDPQNDHQLFEKAKLQYYAQNNVSESSKLNMTMDEDDEDDEENSFDFIYYPEGGYGNISLRYSPCTFRKMWDLEESLATSKSSMKSSKKYLRELPVHTVLKNVLTKSKQTKDEILLENSEMENTLFKPWSDFRVPVEYAEKLASIKKRALPLRKFPITFESVGGVMKEGRLCLRKQYIHAFTEVYVALRQKFMMVRETKKSRIILFEYSLKDCLVKESGLIFSLTVRDPVSHTTLHFLPESEEKRDEWITAINSVKVYAEEEKPVEYLAIEIGSLNKVADFKISKVIGRGSYGKVLRITHLKNNRNYITKVMRKDVVEIHGWRRTVVEELRRSRSNKHKYLQELKDGCVMDDFMVFYMKYPKGRCLAHYLLGSGIHDEKIGAYYGSQLAMVLIYLHSRNIIHRALNVHNLYLDREGNLKVVEFGMCIETMGGRRYNRHIRQHPCYVAPELLQEKPYHFATDWWAYGICCLVMITGKEPFINKEEHPFINEYDIYTAIESDDLHFDFKDITPQAENFLRKLLEKNPNCRLGCEGSELEILGHEFFAEMMYYNYNKIKIVPPLHPSIEDRNDKCDPFIYPRDQELKKHVKLTPPRGGKRYALNKSVSLPNGFERKNLIIKS